MNAARDFCLTWVLNLMFTLLVEMCELLCPVATPEVSFNLHSEIDAIITFIQQTRGSGG